MMPRRAEYSTRVARFLHGLRAKLEESSAREATAEVWLASFGAIEYVGLPLGYTGRLLVTPPGRCFEQESPDFFIGLHCTVAHGVPTEMDEEGLTKLGDADTIMARAFITAWHELAHLESLLNDEGEPPCCSRKLWRAERTAMRFAGAMAWSNGIPLRGLQKRWGNRLYCEFLSILMAYPGPTFVSVLVLFGVTALVTHLLAHWSVWYAFLLIIPLPLLGWLFLSDRRALRIPITCTIRGDA